MEIAPHNQNTWTPQTVIGTVATIGGLKLMYNGLQKMFNPNKRSLSISNSNWFSGAQGGESHKTQTITVKIPQGTQLPTHLTINFQRLSKQEEDKEFEEGGILLGSGIIVTVAGLCYLKD